MKTKTTKYTKYRTLYLPKEIVDCLLLHVYSGLCDFDFNIEIGLNILNDIHTKDSIFNKDEDYNIKHIPLYSSLLRVKYGDTYVQHKNFMVQYNIIWNDSSYKNKATHFYLFDINQYQSNNNRIIQLKNLSLDNIFTTYSLSSNIKISLLNTINKGNIDVPKNRILTSWYKIKIPITKSNKKFLTADYVKDSTFINNTVSHVKKMGSHFRKHFKIDYEGALLFVNQQYVDELQTATNIEEERTANYRYASRLSSIFLINDGKNNKSLRFNRNSTNKRIDTNLTNMATDVRPFIIGYKDMSYLDLKNSQPVLFNILLKRYHHNSDSKLKTEIEAYYELTINGKWYEWLQSIYGLERAECKKIWMKIAYSKNKSYKSEKKVFKQYYPEIYSIIESYKKDNHADFAILLQKTESGIFIDEICKELVNIDIIPYTLHDGLLVPKENEQATLEVMQTVLKKHLGAVPQISIE
ncbi:hypothetical protein DFQ09_102238 [Winogradskyella pacifica]|uniref:Uncharacterized protein n=1 Tax=Winogradskyella pacifica TaxID=664642 RepID=A0A3D9N1Q2_9FLAO|nr:hypothetical protein [Winogradskyella pacifica]REE25647.1 hypothetical protein DFQ09_102238 [Winogradskyella pacifica]